MDQLVADYEKGDGAVYDLAAIYGVHRQTIANHVKERGCVLKGISKLEITHVKQIHRDGWNASRMGTELGGARSEDDPSVDEGAHSLRARLAGLVYRASTKPLCQAA